MKLRNKKTGEIVDLSEGFIKETYSGERIEIKPLVEAPLTCTTKEYRKCNERRRQRMARQKRNAEYYKKIGRKGGKIGGTKSWNGGFASEIHGKDGLTGQERARIAGRKGGKKSKRGPQKHWW